ncbi:hypothetical protein E2C01_089904 [Portunus trituberculatus]|uniref:Uncharacterized protein n=1 Tax=Portunus trituberculatus TaxID=210409 RepID=A0A5B7JK15_PORTR|nr:hypothetical protein [Portunus trituberculatus]
MFFLSVALLGVGAVPVATYRLTLQAAMTAIWCQARQEHWGFDGSGAAVIGPAHPDRPAGRDGRESVRARRGWVSGWVNISGRS